MSGKDKVRLGVVGIGVMGTNHLRSAAAAGNLTVAAVCDIRKERADRAAAEYKVPAFYSHRELLESGLVDAVLIVTPHYSHTPIAIDAFRAGIHVLSDKPVAVHVADARRMLAAQREAGNLKFGVMFQLRTSPANIAFKKLLDSGELGRIIRINWIITTWLRSRHYHDSGEWRASWRGEGGGVLLNQCPHQLDLFQWFFGMPEKVRAFCHFGRFHDIEVEDEVSAYMEFQDGVSAVFVTSTGEAPGTNRLEVTCDRGRLVLENGKLSFDRLPEPVSETILNSSESIPEVNPWRISIPVPSNDISATEVLERFAEAILEDKEPLVTGQEALKELELGNAMLLSTWKNREISLPLDSAEYEKQLMRLVAVSRYRG